MSNKHDKVLGFAFALAATVGMGGPAAADNPAATPAACKPYKGAKCCDPNVVAHLTKQSVFSSCGKSEADFLGEVGSKDTCKYMFKVGAEPEDRTFVQVYAPAQKDPGTAPTDPFFDWTRVGKAYVTKKAKLPKDAAMLQNTTGIWFPGKDYVVSVTASTKVCTKPQALKLAGQIK